MTQLAGGVNHTNHFDSESSTTQRSSVPIQRIQHTHRHFIPPRRQPVSKPFTHLNQNNRSRLPRGCTKASKNSSSGLLLICPPTTSLDLFQSSGCEPCLRQGGNQTCSHPPVPLRPSFGRSLQAPSPQRPSLLLHRLTGPVHRLRLELSTSLHLIFTDLSSAPPCDRRIIVVLQAISVAPTDLS